MDEQRLGAFAVSGELMRDYLFHSTPNGQWLRIDAGIPADAEYVRCYEDPVLNRFVFIYRHPSFPLRRPGERVQFLDSPQITALHGVRIDRKTGQVVVRSLATSGVRVATSTEEFFADAPPAAAPYAAENGGGDEAHVVEGGA